MDNFWFQNIRILSLQGLLLGISLAGVDLETNWIYSVYFQALFSSATL